MKTTSHRRLSSRPLKTSHLDNGNGRAPTQRSKPAVSARVTSWLAKPKQNLIGGRWVPSLSRKTFDVFNPADATVIARVPAGHKEDINRAVIAARRAFETGSWRRLTPSERGKLIWRIGDLILEHADELAEIESLDNGKPRAVARVADIPLAADLFHYMAGWAVSFGTYPDAIKADMALRGRLISPAGIEAGGTGRNQDAKQSRLCCHVMEPRNGQQSVIVQSL